MTDACLVACAKSKRETRSPAWALYDSTLFEKSFTAAMLMGHPYVMSAKHGLVRPDERLDPYDEYLGDKTAAERRSWGADVVADIPQHYDRIVVFGGRHYVEPIIEHADRAVIDVYESCSGNGQQMAVAGQMATELLDGGEY